MGEIAAATVAAKSHLSYARVLAESFRRLHPGVPFYVLLADEVDGYFDPGREPFDLLRLGDLKIPDLPRFRFHYTQQELTYAATPYLLEWLLDRGFACAAFLKQESLVLGDLSPVFELMRRSPIVLTPHLLEPLAGGAERELNILQSGVFNVGFLGVADTPTGRAFLTWWRERLYEHCRHNVPEGMHFEQRWLDLAPAFFQGVEFVRDPGFNVGHWNLPEREVQVGGDGAVTVDGVPGRFFRFSGFDPDRPHLVTRYNARLDMGSVGPAAGLFRRYLGLLEGAGYRETSRWPYAYGQFDNGEPVTDAARRVYRELGEEARRFGNPFETSRPDGFYQWYARRKLSSLHWPPGVRDAAVSLWLTVRERPGGTLRAAAELLGAARRSLTYRAGRILRRR